MDKTINVAISKEWFDDIKDEIVWDNAYYYTEKYTNREMVEVDVMEGLFNRVSEEHGWG